MSSSLALFAVFVLNWFAPTMGLGAAFVSLFLLGAVMQLMATWMPYRGKTKVLHNQFAYTAAGIMPILLAFMIFGPHISETARAVIICLLAIMVIFIALFRSIQRAMHRYLYFQVAYLASFHLAFLAATYFSR